MRKRRLIGGRYGAIVVVVVVSRWRRRRRSCGSNPASPSRLDILYHSSGGGASERANRHVGVTNDASKRCFNLLGINPNRVLQTM